jgi:hypothetical protein
MLAERVNEGRSEAAKRPKRLGVGGLVLFAALSAVIVASAVAAPPSNDDFAAAQVLSGAQPIVVQGTTREATRESGDPAGFPASVWYRWTAPASGRIAIEFCAQNAAAAQSTSVSVYRGETLPTLQEVFRTEIRPPSGSCPFSQVDDPPAVYDVVAGTTYRIYVGSQPDMQGSFGLVVTSFIAPAPNDEFSNAAVLGGPLPVRAVGHPHDSDDGTFWYRWTAPANGSFTLEDCVERASDSISVGLFTGSSEPALRRVPTQSEYSNVSECPFDRGPTEDLKQGSLFRATRGTSYVVRVGADPFYGGRFGFALKRKEVYDLAVGQSISRGSVPAGGVVVVKLTVTNRGNITAPVRAEPRIGFSQSINRPGAHNSPGKGRYLSVRSPGGRCSKGFFFKVPVAGCAVKRLAPGEKMVATMRIRVLGSILLEVESSFGDDRRGNNEPRAVVRAR